MTAQQALHWEPCPPVCVSTSTCLRADLENSNIGPVNKSQAPSKKKPDRVHSKHEGANMKCKPNCAPGGTLSKTRLASCSGGILAGSTGECWRAAPARYWLDTWQDPPARDTQRDTWRGLLVSYSGILGGIHWLSWNTQLLWQDTRRDPLINCGILGGIHWLSWNTQLWRDTRQLPLIDCGILGGIHWQATDELLPGSASYSAALVGYSAGSTELLWQNSAGSTLRYSSGYSAGSTGGLLWWDTWRDPLASRSGDTRRDPLASCFGGILGGGSVATADSNIKSNNPFLSGGEKRHSHMDGSHSTPTWIRVVGFPRLCQKLDPFWDGFTTSASSTSSPTGHGKHRPKHNWRLVEGREVGSSCCQVLMQLPELVSQLSRGSDAPSAPITPRLQRGGFPSSLRLDRENLLDLHPNQTQPAQGSSPHKVTQWSA